MTPAQADACRNTAAAYVHIPFCSAVCPYCDFAVVAGRDDLDVRYVDAVVSEITRSEPWRPLEAVYVGGGTPSRVDPSLLGRVLDALTDRHGITDGAEISLEANPEDFDESRASRLSDIGFNRVSFGAQSFDDRVLLSLGRRHAGSRIARSVEAARGSGFDNISLDLIYGTPGETGSSWTATMASALDLEPNHISAYALTVEPGTELGRSVKQGASAPDPDIQADRYEATMMAVGAAGMSRYEVSNWSAAGYECRYNMTVWAQGEYEAYGNGAHGHRRGQRFRNYRHLDSYLEAIESGQSAVAGEEPVEGWDAELDRLFVGLRRTVGVSLGPGGKAFVQSTEGSRLIEAGIVELSAGRLTVKNPMLTDEVHRIVLDLEEPDWWAQHSPDDIVLTRENA